MPQPRKPVGAARRDEWALLLRVFVLFPALLTAVAVAASTLLSRGPLAVELGGSIELDPADGAHALPEPRFGPVLAEVHSASDATQIPGGWAVLDRRAQQIVLLDDRGGLVGVSGGAGEGPGELSRAFALARIDSSLVVIDAAGRALDLFDLRGRFQSRVPLRQTSCAAAPVRQLVEGPGALALLSLCTRSNGSTSALVERIRLTGAREVLLDSVYNDLASGRVDPSRAPLLATVGGRLHFAITPGRCVKVLEGAVEEPERICHPDPHPIPIPDSLKTALRALEPRVRSMGATLVVPERLPPFTGILEVQGRLAFHVVVDDSTHALEVVRGGRLERILLPLDTDFATGTRGFLFAQDRPEGTVFAVVPNP
jgi:hypothetical protein